MENNQGNKIYLGIIALLLLLLIGSGYLLWDKNRKNDALTAEKEQIEAEYKNLSDTLEARKAYIEQLISENSIKDDSILAMRDELVKKQQQLQAAIASGKKDRAELQKLRQMLANYENSIAEMKARIEQLVAQNKQLTEQNKQLTRDLDEAKATTAQLSETNKNLSRKVELGSLLQLRNIEVVGVKKKGSGEDKVVKRAKVTESLRISFETGENKVLEPGTLTLYIRVISPKGETIAVADKGSGTFKLAETGEVLQYSQKAEFDWNQSNKKVVVYWSSNVNQEGTYKVEVYQSGYLIGKGSVELN
ncbi:MAG: hypothetical protein NZM35_11960 [Chitinophagales bacterium]|nr:hypothetical protein [Chitinophagales bacterium]MDW8420095.1 hypothetical protein [Chitinophagales bacterium]